MSSNRWSCETCKRRRKVARRGDECLDCVVATSIDLAERLGFAFVASNRAFSPIPRPDVTREELFAMPRTGEVATAAARHMAGPNGLTYRGEVAYRAAVLAYFGVPVVFIPHLSTSTHVLCYPWAPERAGFVLQAVYGTYPVCPAGVLAPLFTPAGRGLWYAAKALGGEGAALAVAFDLLRPRLPELGHFAP